MKIVGDTHFHTVASGHAYSTVKEVAEEAVKKGLEIIAMTDHCPAFPGGPHRYHFSLIDALPDEICGVRVLKGAEVNIIDFEGNLDLQQKTLERLEFVIASLHNPILGVSAGTVEQNTNALINAVKNPLVDVIGHPDDPKFSINPEQIVKAAKEYNKLIEANNNNFIARYRQGGEETLREILRLCVKYGVKITTGSDAHYCEHIGRIDRVIEILGELGVPEELVVTSSKERILEHLRSHGRKV